jgi:hypothetical protein
LSALVQESGWSLSDRLRLWHILGEMAPYTGLTIRELDLKEKALVPEMTYEGMEVADGQAAGLVWECRSSRPPFWL